MNHLQDPGSKETNWERDSRAAKVKKSMSLDQASDSRNRKKTMPKTKKKFSFWLWKSRGIVFYKQNTSINVVLRESKATTFIMNL